MTILQATSKISESLEEQIIIEGCEDSFKLSISQNPFNFDDMESEKSLEINVNREQFIQLIRSMVNMLN